MARSSYIYLVKPKNQERVLAAFTVKYESQLWAERSHCTLDSLERFRMDDCGRLRPNTEQVPCPWEEE